MKISLANGGAYGRARQLLNSADYPAVILQIEIKLYKAPYWERVVSSTIRPGCYGHSGQGDGGRAAMGRRAAVALLRMILIMRLCVLPHMQICVYAYMRIAA